MPRFESSTPSLIIYNTRMYVGYNEPVAAGYEHQKAPRRDGCEAFCVAPSWALTRGCKILTEVDPHCATQWGKCCTNR